MKEICKQSNEQIVKRTSIGTRSEPRTIFRKKNERTICSTLTEVINKIMEY